MSQRLFTQLSQGGTGPPAEIFLGNVKSLIERPEFGSEVSTQSITEVIVLLSDMFGQLPKAGGGVTKEDFNREVGPARLYLEAIERVSGRKEGILVGKERVVTGKLLAFIATIDGWEAQAGPSAEEIGDLKTGVLQVMVKILRHRMDETFTAVQKFEDGVLIANASFREMAVTARHIAACELEAYPLVIKFFEREQSGEQEIHLNSSHHGLSFAISLLQTIVHFLEITNPATFSANIVQETVVSIGLLIDSILKSRFSKPHPHFLRLLSTARVLIQTSPRRAKALQPYIFRIIATRLHDHPDITWDEIDQQLALILDSFFQDSALTGQYLEGGPRGVADLFAVESNRNEVVLGYLAHYAIRCPSSSLDTLRLIAEKAEPSQSSNLLLIALRRRQDVPSSPNSKMNCDDDSSWQEHSRAKLREILLAFPGNDLMDLDGDDWQTSALHRVYLLVSSELSQWSRDQRIRLANQLLDLPRELVPPKSHQRDERIPYDLASLYILATTRLLDGPADIVDTDVARTAYNALAQGLRSHQIKDKPHSELDLSSVVRNLEGALTNKSRPVRLSVGRVLVELFKISQEAGEPSANRIGSIIACIRHVLGGRLNHAKETALVTLGMIGHIANPDTLPTICFDLITELGHPNPVLRGVAFLQLVNLAKQAKSPYSLVAPDLPRIGRYVASNCHKQPLLLSEFCRFISYSPPSLLSQTILDWLPTLVSTCAEEEIMAISRIMDRTVASLIVDKPAEVLEMVFMLDTVQKTEASLDFILRHLPAYSQSNSRGFGVSNLVRSELLSVLGRLVIRLGDDSVATRDQVLSAISKVEKCVADVKPSSKRTSVSMSHCDFLRMHIMGIVSHLNSELQEAHGKRSIEAKCKVLRGIKEVLSIIGDASAVVSPQLVTMMQNTVLRPGLAESTLETWHTLATVLKPIDFTPYLALTSAIFAESWTLFDPGAKATARRTLEYIIGNVQEFRNHLNSLAYFGDIDELNDVQEAIAALSPKLTLVQKLGLLCTRITDSNASVSHLAIVEAKKFISNHEEFLPLVSGDNFDPVVGSLVKALHMVAGREGEAFEASRLQTFECLGMIGALDPDRFEIPHDKEDPLISFADFEEEKHSQAFAAYMIGHVLAPVFPRTSDVRFQSLLAYTIQELLSFCGFTAALITQDNGNPVSVKVVKRWKTLSDEVRAIVAPLLNSNFTAEGELELPDSYPVYASAPTYKEWIQKFAAYLISQVKGKHATRVFTPFRVLLHSADVQVLLFLLPHLVLDVLSSGLAENVTNIRNEVISVLEDQVRPAAGRSADMRLLCAQTIFHLMDHLNKYLRYTGIVMAQAKRQKGHSIADRHRIVESLMTSIDHSLMAQAAFKCKQYARALMSLEQRVQQMRRLKNVDKKLLQIDYDKMHELYANLDEPDGMNGISSMVLSPTLEHQIREHESTGRWTSAQSCWEVSLQQNPDNLKSQIGLLRCLRNLGHFDTLRTHLAGVLSRNPHWKEPLEPFRLEGAWNARDWHTVEDIVSSSQSQSPELSTGKLLLALKSRDNDKIANALALARTYDASVNLHLVEELAMISRFVVNPPQGEKDCHTDTIPHLSATLDHRYNSVLPSYRTLEPILSLRRTIFDLLNTDSTAINALVGRYWLASSKIARKAGHFQAAYSALLQGRERGASYYFIQGCKLLHSSGESIRALQELNNALSLTGDDSTSEVIDLTEDEDEVREIRRNMAKARLLRARWMQVSGRFSRAELNAQFSHVAQLYGDWEASYFHWALYLDRSQVHKDIPANQLEEYINHISHVVRYYGKSLVHGSKHLYQTLPRMLTLWLNLGQRDELQSQKGTPTIDHAHRSAIKKFGLLCDWVREDLVENVDPFKESAFPQIVSRLVNNNQVLARTLFTIIGKVIQEFPQQALWIISGVSGSLKKERGDAALRAIGFGLSERIFPKNISPEHKERLLAIFQRVGPLANVYAELNKELIRLCNFDVEQAEVHDLTIKCPRLSKMELSNVIVPLQDSFTSRIPPMSSQILHSRPFPHTLPTIKGFLKHIQVMPSLQKPRKIGVEANNGDSYYFLCKPKDDLRKDARLMDFNSVVNKLLQANSESRRRQLHIRTYSVVPLNEECGLIEWVRNTAAMRALLKPRYDAVGIPIMPTRIQEYFNRFKILPAEQVAKTFETKILAEFPPKFHEWFLETFPEPTTWFASRLAYSRTTAVISMVGYIIGLGDRHCENIMLDEGTGETVHCDFNCLFDKGRTFDVPENVPFRLTQNVVDGMGITGYEGSFRICCEITMQLLRSNQDCLMSVLEAFIHDPLVEWEDERKRKERRREIHIPVDLKKLALGALNPIERKLQGTEGETQISVSNQVDKLIQEAISTLKLGKMYVGWAPWMVSALSIRRMSY